EETPNIELHTNTEVVALEGNDHLERVTWRNNQTGQTESRNIAHLFSMPIQSSCLVGCEPRWGANLLDSLGQPQWHANKLNNTVQGKPCSSYSALFQEMTFSS